MTDQNIESDEQKARSKTLWVLGATFLLPIIITLIAVYVYL
ncbi:hypothetical protein [uncultured Bdellovibrio sp.]|nr:hypothetical protein [uncultured Bdellovibrio sp.]